MMRPPTENEVVAETWSKEKIRSSLSSSLSARGRAASFVHLSAAGVGWTRTPGSSVTSWGRRGSPSSSLLLSLSFMGRWLPLLSSSLIFTLSYPLEIGLLSWMLLLAAVMSFAVVVIVVGVQYLVQSPYRAVLHVLRSVLLPSLPPAPATSPTPPSARL